MILTENLTAKKHYDIIVAGGGVAGVAAAVQAAREGKQVLMIEKSQKLGGLATLGLINLFVPMCNGRGKQIIFGMAEELLRLSIRYGWDDMPEGWENGRFNEEKMAALTAEGKLPPRYMTRYSAEIFALAMTELCVECGVEIMFDAIVSRPVMTDEGGKIRVEGVVVENKSGREYFTADYFVDATGDSDLLYRAGVPCVDRGNFHTYIGFKLTLDSCKKAVETGDIRFAHTGVCGGGSSLYGGGHPEGVPLYYGTTSEEVNRYLIANQLEMLKKIKKEDRKSRDIITLPGMAQFRTTRRIDGAYVLKETDTYRHFDDSVAAINDFDRRDYLFEVPYRTLYSNSAKNLITCGRTAAGDGYAWDVLRVIPPAIITGQAAGFALSLALDAGKCDVAAVDVARLQAKMEAANNAIHFDDADVPEVSRDVIEHND